MNNLQHIVKNDTRAAMHMAVELCEQGDFDSVNEALWWLLQEIDDDTTMEEEANNGTRWYELFSTPERAARTMVTIQEECETSNPCYPNCPFGHAPICPRCPSYSELGNYDVLLEWLKQVVDA